MFGGNVLNPTVFPNLGNEWSSSICIAGGVRCMVVVQDINQCALTIYYTARPKRDATAIHALLLYLNMTFFAQKS